ncbi:hypothetical protein OIU84_028972 [Salix udensis]|uniref:Rx N-terminal domain-containing protein n=1 Tax=Salix udensis TaxID=889485 RepID=A0AAD6P9K0_9ROSI|nr:hypothetical protein OIU84_028972 [Salix udensis]
MAFQGEIGSAFLKSSVDLLVHKFSSPEVQRFFQRQKLPEGRRLPFKLTDSLKSVDSMLLVAEGKQTTKEGVKDWLDEVQHVVHEAEDLLDVIFCQARGSKLEPGYFNNEEKIISSLNDILERLGGLEKRAHTLCLIKCPKRRLPCSSLMEVEFGAEFLRSTIVLLVQQLGSPIEFRGSFRSQILNEGLSEKFKEPLNAIKTMLPEAETKQITNEDVKSWLQHATDAVYEAASLLDDIVLEAGQAELKSSTQSYPDKIQNVFSSLCTSKKNNKEGKMVENLVKIFGKLEILAKEGDNRHNLLRSDGPPHIDTGVCGRDYDKETIMPLLISEDAKDSRISPKTRHIWCPTIRGYEDLKNLVGDGSHIFRTILPISNESFWGDVNDEKLKAFNRLRVLSLSNINRLPDVLGWLKHLRHLEISGESIKSLPETLCMLFTLQTLILRQCPNLAELPANIVNLTELCHLDIRETGLQQTPPQMGKLKKLETLTDFFVGQQNGCRIDELGELRYLLGDLRIMNLQNVSHDAIEADLKGKNVKKLELRWSGRRNSDDSLAEEDVLEALKPSAKVEDISITGFGGKKLPEWLGHTSFENLVYLRLCGCKYCVSLPSLGQLESLRTLLIEGFYNLESVGDEFYGSPANKGNPFRSLESLTFERMLQWREWESEGRAFPSLQVLCIRKCPSLTTLPSDLPSLVELEIAKCKLVGLPSGWSPATIKRIMLANDFHKLQLEKSVFDSQSLTVDSFHAFDFIRQEIENWGYACTALQKIDITRCPLEFFPLNLFPQLKQLEISRCRKLKSLCGPEEPLGESMSTKSFYSGCPTLETLALSHCSNFESLFCSLPSLENLKIVACGKLQSLPGMDFSASIEPLAGSNWNSEVCKYPKLKILSLEHCSNFESLFCSLPSHRESKNSCFWETSVIAWDGFLHFIRTTCWQ